MAKDELMRTKVDEANIRKDEYLARRVEEEEKEHGHLKKSRIEVDEVTMEELSPASGGATSSRRPREDDQDEAHRPTQYRTVMEDVPVPEDNANDVDCKNDEEAMALEACYAHKATGGDKRGKYDVCEAFSPPRTCARARERGMRGGWSLD